MNDGPLFTSKELLTCSVFNLKMFIYVLMIIICISFVLSFINSLVLSFLPAPTMPYREFFSNDQFFSYKDTINRGYFSYQTAQLTSQTNDLIAGQANKYIYTQLKTNKPIYHLDILANLYVLNGNPFSTISSKDQYIAYLKNTKTGEMFNVGQLLRDGDGKYKLSFKSENIEQFAPYNEIILIYKTEKQEELPILNGKFTLL